MKREREQKDHVSPLGMRESVWVKGGPQVERKRSKWNGQFIVENYRLTIFVRFFPCIRSNDWSINGEF